MARSRIVGILFTSALIALINQAAARAEERLGEVNFPISCSPAAQAQFNRAVALLHSFFFPETVKAFTAIAEKEPSCAMAYWGIAISQRPNPLVGPFPGDVLKIGWEGVEKARAATQKTERESGWIEALAAFYLDYATVPQRTRTANYEAAMARLVARHPMTRRRRSSMRLLSTRSPTPATRPMPNSSRPPISSRSWSRSFQTTPASRITSSTAMIILSSLCAAQ